MSQIELTPSFSVHATGEQSLYQRRFKRAFDLVVGSLTLLVFLPVIAVLALMIRTSLGPGVFYRQTRVGLAGDPFTIWKFRTMHNDRRAQQGDIDIDRRTDHKTTDDPRHTTVGLILRKLSLDELPQLWNVVRGEMSLVGPRPEIPEVAEARGYLDHVRHAVKPGITGPYQVSDLRHAGDLRDGLELDAAYASSVTLRGDVRYLLLTLVAMAKSSGS